MIWFIRPYRFKIEIFDNAAIAYLARIASNDFDLVLAHIGFDEYQTGMVGYGANVERAWLDDFEVRRFGCLACVPADSPNVVSTRTCQDHDGRWLCLDMDATDIEPRLPGVTNVEVKLDATVWSVNATVACEGAEYVGTPQVQILPPCNTLLNVAFDPPLPDGICCQVSLAGDVSGVFNVRGLLGDVDRDGAVTTGDASQLRFFFNQDAATAGAQWDVDASGTVTTGDFSQVRFFFNNTAAECP